MLSEADVLPPKKHQTQPREIEEDIFHSPDVTERDHSWFPNTSTEVDKKLLLETLSLSDLKRNEDSSMDQGHTRRSRKPSGR